MISPYSFFAAVLWLNVAMVLVDFFRGKTDFLVKYSTSVLLFSAALGVLRVLLPLDFTFAYVIRSYKIMPAVRNFFKADVIPGEEYLKLGTLIIWIWLAGVAAVFTKTLCRLVREKKQLRRIVIIKNEQVEWVCDGLRIKNAQVAVSPNVGVPMVSGVFKAHIFLPELLLSDEQWELVIGHEYQHFKNHDSLIKLFYLTLSSLFWWNPVVHRFQKELDRLLELRCDAKVTRLMGDEEKTAYLATILAVMKQLRGTGSSAIPLTASPLVSAKAESFTAQRFYVILESEKKSKALQIIISTLIIAAFLLSYLVIIQPAGFPEGDKTEVGTFIEPNNAYILILEDGSRKLYVEGEYFWDVSDEMLGEEPQLGLPIYERSLP